MPGAIAADEFDRILAFLEAIVNADDEAASGTLAYIRTAPLWPLLCGMQYAQDIHFSPQAIDLINQNKMRVNNQFPGTFHTTVAAFIGVRLENGKYPTLRLFFVRFDIDIA